MNPATPEVWKLLWPNGISPADYEAAFMIAQLASTVARKEEPTVRASERLDVNQAAKILGTRPAAVYDAIRRGKLRATKDVGRLWVSKEDVEGYRKTRQR